MFIVPKEEKGDNRSSKDSLQSSPKRGTDSPIPLLQVPQPDQEAKVALKIPSFQISVEEEDSTMRPSPADSPLPSCPSTSPSSHTLKNEEEEEEERDFRPSTHAIPLATLLQVPGCHPRRRHSWICRYLTQFTEFRLGLDWVNIS